MRISLVRGQFYSSGGQIFTRGQIFSYEVKFNLLKGLTKDLIA